MEEKNTLIHRARLMNVLASRCVVLYDSYARFGVQRVNGGSLNYYNLLNSNNGNENEINFAVRPVASIT